MLHPVGKKNFIVNTFSSVWSHDCTTLAPLCRSGSQKTGLNSESCDITLWVPILHQYLRFHHTSRSMTQGSQSLHDHKEE